ncbi:MAG TPA: ABC transporter substrate-binding protein [Chloroflexota bacterium]|nr:ABC transporter substrate-binding protein [Chloroflexota bacterium]
MRIGSLLALALLALVACGPSRAPAPAASAPPPASAPQAAAPAAPAAPAAQPANGPVTVRVAANLGASDAGIFLAMDRGFFAEQGLDVDLTRGSSELLPSLVNGDLDVLAPAVSAALLNAMARDIPLRIVADKGSDPPGFSYQVITLRKDLYDSGQVRGWGDLRGRRLAEAGVQSSVDFLFARGLATAGLTLNDVELVSINYPDMNAAFANGTIDAASFWEPLLTVGIDQGWVVRWKPVEEIDPGHQSGILIYGKNFLGDHQELGHRFMKAYVQGVRVYNDAYRKGLGRDAVNNSIASHAGVKPELQERTVPAGLNPDGCANSQDLADQLAWFRSIGYLQRDLELDAVVDNRFCERAVQELGRYPS